MSIRDRLRGGIEQLAPSNSGDGDEPAPRGEHRRADRVRDEDGERGFLSWVLGYSTGSPSDEALTSERRPPPATIDEYWTQYYEQFALTRAPLNDFSSSVVAPGYRIRAHDADGERDEDMEEALQLWAENCVIHAGELGHDLRILLEQIPKKRRGKGTELVEKVGTDTDPDAVVALMTLDPSTFKFHTRERQPILIQPDDEVAEEHPRTPTGKAAAYTQYHEDVVTPDSDKDPIHFSVDDVIKFTWDVDDGEVWGTSIYESIDDRIDALLQKLEDRDFAIRQTGYPHRIYSSDNWSMGQAEEYAEAHKEGDVSSEYGPEDDEKRGGDQQSFAGRVDFVPHEVNVQVESGNVPDLADPIRDDVEHIFAVMPVGKYQIAYADDLNQFVVDPQKEKDEEAIDDERRYLERKFQPVIQEKADELASGERYEGEITFVIEPPEDENPLRRESFPAENLQTFANAWKAYKQGNVEQDLPAGAFAEFAGFDLESKQDEYEWEADPLELGDGQDTPGAMEEIAPDQDEETEEDDEGEDDEGDGEEDGDGEGENEDEDEED